MSDSRNPAWGGGGGDGTTNPIGTAVVASDPIWQALGDLAVAAGSHSAQRLPVGTPGQVLTADPAQALGVRWSSAGGGLLADPLWDAKGDLPVGSGPDSGGRLPVGGDGQVLTADSSQGLGIKWAPAAGGGAIATNTFWDAKGDLAVASGADAASRLAVGTNGQVLTADSAQATGVKWAAAPGGGVAADIIFDAKGDLPVGTGPDTAVKVAVGTDGQVLTADSAQTAGLRWGTAPGVAIDPIFDAKGDLPAGTGADASQRVPVGSNGQYLRANSAQAAGLEWGAQTTLATDPLADAKGDIFAATAADLIGRLPVGTNGQILTADSAQALGVKWSAAGSGAVAADTIWDAKGDLAVGTGADTAAKLSVGANGTIPIADSSQATGIRWGSAGSASDGIPVINVVRDNGAVAYASSALALAGTDSTTAIQAAINTAAGAGKTVYIPEGFYKVTSLSVPHTGNFRIQGAGKNSVLCQTSAADRAMIWHDSSVGVNSVDNVWIEGIYFLGAGQGIAGGGNNQRGAIWMEMVSNLVIRDCWMTDCRDAGINLYPKGNVRIEGNRLERICNGSTGWNAINYDTMFYAGQVGAVGDIWVVNNYVSDVPTGGIVGGAGPTFAGSAGPRIEMRTYLLGNTTVNCDWVGIAVESRYAQFVTIANNQVYNCWVSIQAGTGGGTEFANISAINYMTITNNLIDMRQRTSGAVASGGGIVTLGSRIAVIGNFVRHSVGGIVMDHSGSGGAIAEYNVVQGNILEASTGNIANTNFAVSLSNMRRSLVQGNEIHRHAARVIGAQTVGAGGTLQVSTVEGFGSSGTITVKGVQYAYTAIAQAGTATNATLTLTAGGTFVDGDDVFQGNHSHAFDLSACKDIKVDNNLIVNPGATGFNTRTGCQRIAFTNNKIINPWSQNTAGTKCGLILGGSGFDVRVEGNEIIDITGAANATIAYQINASETRAVFIENLADGIATAYNSSGSTVVLDRGNRKTTTHVPNGGVFTSTPGAVTTVSIPHGLLTAPTVFSAQPGNSNARGAPAFFVTADASNVVINFASALTGATSYSWNWTAEV